MKIQETKDTFSDGQTSEIATEITELPCGWQSEAFYKLPRHQAIAVYQSLNSSVQQHLREDFQKKVDLDFLDKLSPDERIQLFELLYTPKAGQDAPPAENEDVDHSPLAIVKRRLGWLFILLLASTATTSVIKSQEYILQQVVVLASFIPLLIAYGGNVSTQTATVVVRALNTQKTQLKSLIQQVLYREMISGIILGAILGVMVTGEAMLLQDNPIVALVIGVSLFTISVLASFCGAMLPFFFQVLGFDPALMSAPLGATLVDVAGILIYLQIARLFLHI
ncbi:MULTISPECIES: magnesium transporter [unclassified Nodularia (in: cyanobacteria)]|uniref:magnesium transporter n=1 Tax=unclassified Nodularia (in: cyanobacteria) TaxID=2656917 RepID=UPI0018809A25|nr:magnesium transporter [Nodularia sp. LEGE 06071]MBE9198964.1 magnesium transporter [Nodularia sp. LEGE 06071]MCC2695891.1 magnesium transporter [Nodularia sp. LEGE 04288]